MKSFLESPGMLARWLLVLGAALALFVSLVDYVARGNGIDHTAGAFLVIVSSALILGASLALALRWIGPRWLAVLLDILILLGLVGTATAAYFLEAEFLLGLMILALCAWLVAVLTPSRTAARAQLAGDGATP